MPRVAKEVDAVDQIVDDWSACRPDLDVSALQVFGRLHRTFLHYQSAIVPIFEHHGINMASFDVMAALRRRGEPFRMTAGELAASSLVTTGGITQRVDRLEEQGLVVRERDTQDRRVVYIQLTGEGLAVIDTVANEHFANELALLAELSGRDRTALAELLSRLERSVQTTRTR